MTTSTPVGSAPPAPRPRRPLVRTRLTIATAVVVALTAAGLTLLHRDDGGTTPDHDASVSPTGASSVVASTPAPAPSSRTTPSSAFRFQPVWPFASVADAVAWQAQARTNGSQSWRLDPAEVAVAFASQHLAYAEVNRVTSREVTSEEAWIGVAASPPEGRAVSAAVLHLARIGQGALNERPWEVVGSRDTLLTLTAPRYGATVGTTLVAGGRITGVDESLVVQVRDRDGALLARSRSISVGGQRTPWQVPLVLPATTAGVVTIAVSTGGHLTEVEKFAITAVVVHPGAITFATASAALAAATTGGSYVGDCDRLGSLAGVRNPVCSRFVTSADGRSLYRLGFVNTDAGCFVVLGAQGARWILIEPALDGAHVPPALGGPIAEP